METGPLVEFWIEIDQHSNIKYEYDNKNKKLVIDRISPIPYPYAYGLFPGTLGSDGDELDMLWIQDQTTNLIKNEMPYISHGYIVGGLVMEDEKGMDEKIFVVSPEHYNSFMQKSINEKIHIYDSIFHFFENYKKEIPNKWSKCHYIIDQKNAIQKYNECLL
jgi:inorganic pyrophosphatase